MKDAYYDAFLDKRKILIEKNSEVIELFNQVFDCIEFWVEEQVNEALEKSKRIEVDKRFHIVIVEAEERCWDDAVVLIIDVSAINLNDDFSEGLVYIDFVTPTGVKRHSIDVFDETNNFKDEIFFFSSYEEALLFYESKKL